MPEVAPPIKNLAGVILAGGKSSRFGSNKALALYNGTPMIRRIADRLAPLFDEILLITNTPEIYAFLGWPMCPDRFPGSGPLAGIHAALATVKSPAAFVCACDMPLIDPGLIRSLASLLGDSQAVIPWLPGGPEPLHAIYHQSALPIIESRLAADRRKISELYEVLKIRRVESEELLGLTSDLKSFENINHQHQFASLSEARI